MHYFQNDNEVEITGLQNFDLKQTFECGQCFRWNTSEEDGAYIGVAMDRAVRVRRAGESVFITGTLKDFEQIWRPYFDLDRDYAAIRDALCIDTYMTAAAHHGSGIHILKQDKWEALCTFILSQCNNIPRIKKIVETLCRHFGAPIVFGNDTYHTFPKAQTLAALTEADLAPLRCGYRAPYILAAAHAVARGELDLEALSTGTDDDAAQALKKLPGIGDKVAGCVILFGLHMLDAFPVDTWIKKAITANYGKGFDASVFSPYAGIAQQYMFYFARSGPSAH